MPLYMTQFTYTPEGWVNLAQQPEDRAGMIQALLERFGGRLHGFYYSLGEYDGLFIYEAPDEATVTAALIAEFSVGYVKALKTMTLLPMERALEAMQRAGAEAGGRRAEA